jgi:DNA modification methylase
MTIDRAAARINNKTESRAGRVSAAERSRTDTRPPSASRSRRRVAGRDGCPSQGNTMQVEEWPLGRIKPYDKNLRKRPQRAIDKLKRSLKTYGCRQPIVVDKKGVIVVGHTRWEAAKSLRLKTFPVHVASNLPPAKIRAYRLMDNRSHQETDWDWELLGLELADLRNLGFDLDMTGFDSREIDVLLCNDDPRADDVPPLPKHAVSRRGDLWLLGNHRLFCGDATEAEAVARVCGGIKPLLMVTDPPYGVGYKPEWRVAVDGGGRHALGKVANDDRIDWGPAWRFFPGDIAYVWHAGIHAGEVGASLLAVEFRLRAQIIWRKQHFVLSRGAYHWDHEPAWYAVRKGRSAHWRGDRTQTTVWDVPNLNPHGGNKQEEHTVHSTQKPIDLMRRPILNHTESGAYVYDPFVGSGTTLIACELTERRCIAMEIDPRYCDVVIERWQNLTGKLAALETGETFDSVASDRRAK